MCRFSVDPITSHVPVVEAVSTGNTCLSEKIAEALGGDRQDMSLDHHKAMIIVVSRILLSPFVSDATTMIRMI